MDVMCSCGNEKQAHILYIVEVESINCLSRADINIVLGPICPGQLEDIDEYNKDEEEA